MNSRETAQSRRDELFAEPVFDSFDQEALRFIGWVTLAPSTHNTQPWKFNVSDEEVVVSIDKERAVAMADPDFRDMFISVGALIRQAEIIGKQLDNVEDLSISADAEIEEVARFTLSPSKKWSSFLDSQLANDISTRQNYRGKYTKKTVAVREVMDIANETVIETNRKSKVAFHVYDVKSEQAQKLCTLTADGIAEAYKSPEFRTEVANHINNNFSKNETGLHGYSLTLNTLLSVIVPELMRRKDIGRKLSQLNLKGMLGSQGIVVVSTEDDTPTDWLDAGRATIDLILDLKTRGIQTSIYAAAIEIGSLRSEVHQVLSKDDQHAQLMFTYGYPSGGIGYSHRQSPASVTTFG